MKKPEVKQNKGLTRPEISKLLKENTTRILSNISAIMKEQKVNQSDLAKRIDSHDTHVSRMFKNDYHKNGLTTNVLGRIAVALDVQLKDLVQ